MTNKELGRAARAALKEAGFNLKDISVRTKYTGWEQCLKVKINSSDVDADAVAKVVKRFRAIDYDEAAQEVLQGGNTFVSVVDNNGYCY